MARFQTFPLTRRLGRVSSGDLALMILLEVDDRELIMTIMGSHGSVVYRAKASHDGRTVALKKVQIFEMMDSKVFHLINIFIFNLVSSISTKLLLIRHD